MASRRARRRPGENRDRLLEAGLIEFGLFGYHGAVTASIAARAEVPQPHLYANFTGKQELFIACLSVAIDTLIGDEADAEAMRTESSAGVHDAVSPVVEASQMSSAAEGSHESLAAAALPANPVAAALHERPEDTAPRADTTATAREVSPAAAAPQASMAFVGLPRSDSSGGRVAEALTATYSCLMVFQAVAAAGAPELHAVVTREMSRLRLSIGEQGFSALLSAASASLLAERCRLA